MYLLNVLPDPTFPYAGTTSTSCWCVQRHSRIWISQQTECSTRAHRKTDSVVAANSRCTNSISKHHGNFEQRPSLLVPTCAVRGHPHVHGVLGNIICRVFMAANTRLSEYYRQVNLPYECGFLSAETGMCVCYNSLSRQHLCTLIGNS